LRGAGAGCSGVKVGTDGSVLLADGGILTPRRFMHSQQGDLEVSSEGPDLEMPTTTTATMSAMEMVQVGPRARTVMDATRAQRLLEAEQRALTYYLQERRRMMEMEQTLDGYIVVLGPDRKTLCLGLKVTQPN
jgi:hypothetical protein